MFLPLAQRFKSAFIMLSSPKTGAHEVKIPRFCLAARVSVQPNRDVLRVSNAVSFHAVEPDQRASADSFEPDQRAQEP